MNTDLRNVPTSALVEMLCDNERELDRLKTKKEMLQ